MIYIFTKYGFLGASSRIRTYQYFTNAGIAFDNIVFNELISDEQLLRRYDGRSYSLFKMATSFINRFLVLTRAGTADTLYIEKELFPWVPGFVEMFFLRNRAYVLNYDDAIFHSYDCHKSVLIRFFYRKKIKTLMRDSLVVICGNKYLAEYAVGAGAKSVYVIPTVVNLSKYKLVKDHKNSSVPRIVWIGSPSTVRYLQFISAALQKVAAVRPFILRVIGVNHFSIDGVDIEAIPWVEESEVQRLLECDIGIMPLLKTKWELGKCGYKIIQYMACGLPVIASDVGANQQIVSNNLNGFLVKNDDDWVRSFIELLDDFKLRKKFGLNGRAFVEANCTVQVTGDLFKRIIFSRKM